MAVVTTPGDVTSNAYVDATDADTYHAARADNAAWAGADTPTKETAIQHATRLLDLLDWVGTKYYESGALRWPRDGVTDQDGLEVSESLIPVFLENATAEYAFVLIRDGDVTAPPSTAGLERIKVDIIELEYNAETSNPSQKTAVLPDSVRIMVQPYLQGSPFELKVRRT